MVREQPRCYLHSPIANLGIRYHRTRLNSWGCVDYLDLHAQTPEALEAILGQISPEIRPDLTTQPYGLHLTCLPACLPACLPHPYPYLLSLALGGRDGSSTSPIANFPPVTALARLPILRLTFKPICERASQEHRPCRPAFFLR